MRSIQKGHLAEVVEPLSDKAKEHFHRKRDTKMVLIPDIFESFMSRAPVPNNHYVTVREEALLWAITTCKYSEEEGKRMRQGDFAYFGAVTVPDARAPELRTVVDWLNWVRIASLPSRLLSC